MHLEQAQQRNARIPEVLNNLAWGLAQKDEPDLERALQLAEAAQGLSPNPEICDTAGTILAKLGRPREAVTQLRNGVAGIAPAGRHPSQAGRPLRATGRCRAGREHRRRVQDLDARLAKEKLPEK